MFRSWFVIKTMLCFVCLFVMLILCFNVRIGLKQNVFIYRDHNFNKQVQETQKHYASVRIALHTSTSTPDVRNVLWLTGRPRAL